MEKTTKKCSKCTAIKKIDLFGKHTISKDGLRSECKSCRNIANRTYSAKWKKNNPDKVNSMNQKWRNKNKEKIKKYYESNKSEIIKKQIDYQRNRRKNDLLYKLSCNIRRLIHRSIEKKGWSKNTKTQQILGCNFESLKKHLEKLFVDRYGRKPLVKELLHIDHIIPVYLAKTEDELIKLNYYNNLQLLTPKDHINKTREDMSKKRGVKWL